jgi:hypothetical protein
MVAAAALFLGCNNNNGSSCDKQTGTSHACIDLAISGSVPSAYWDQLRSQCVQNGGTVVSACSHVGAVGGCSTTTVSGGFTEVLVTWAYAGDPAQLMAACAQNKGVWENP